MITDKFQGKSNVVRAGDYEEIYCRGCNTLLARVRHDDKGVTKMTLLKTRHGEAVYVDIAVSHAKGGMISIECETCKGYVSPAYQLATLALTDKQVRVLDEARKKRIMKK
ncbi:MAG: hypothetical protein WCF77_00040 [Minisyncoccia bacterium]